MTSSNINKIVRSTNITLKPWILSKNTSEIVNTCIQKIYKQSPNSFRNSASDLLQKTTTPRPENKAPIRTLRHTQYALHASTPAAATTRPRTRTGANDRLLSAVMNGGSNNSTKRGGGGGSGAIASLVANKKLLKSPNLKIYGSRRFGSSASSSSASIFRRFDERRRNRMQTAQLNYLLRSFGTTPKPGKFRDLGLNSSVAKYLVPMRNQHMELRNGPNAGPNAGSGQVPQAVPISTAIQRDLMLIDNQLKDRIALGRNKLEKLSPRDDCDIDPMEGWHHPPPADLFLARLNERNVANAELYEQHRRLKTANKLKQFDHLRRLESKTSIGMNTTVGRKFGRVRLTDALSAATKKSTQVPIGVQQQQHISPRLPNMRRFGYRQPPTPPALAVAAPSLPAAPPPTTAITIAPVATTGTEPADALVPALVAAESDNKPSHMATATATSTMANISKLASNSRYNRSSYYQPRKF